MDRTLLLLLAQSCHKFPLLFHPHLWLLEFSISASGSFCKGEEPGRRVSQKQCLTASQALAQLCAFLDV